MKLLATAAAVAVAAAPVPGRAAAGHAAFAGGCSVAAGTTERGDGPTLPYRGTLRAFAVAPGTAFAVTCEVVVDGVVAASGQWSGADALAAERSVAFDVGSVTVCAEVAFADGTYRDCAAATHVVVPPPGVETGSRTFAVAGFAGRTG